MADRLREIARERERQSALGDAESFRQACWSVAPTLDVEVGGPESQREVQVRRDGIHVNAPRLGRAHGAHHQVEGRMPACCGSVHRSALRLAITLTMADITSF
jgi:hypothetical protein